MIKKILLIGLILMLPLGYADDTADEAEDPALKERIAERLVDAVSKPPITFVAFTSEEIIDIANQSDDDEIFVEGLEGQQQIVIRDEAGIEVYRSDLADMVVSLNEMEQKLNKMGLTLRNDDGIENIMEYYTDPAQFRQQVINAFAIPLSEEALKKAEDYLENNDIPMCPQLDVDDVLAHVKDVEADTPLELSNGDVMTIKEYVAFANNSAKVLCIISAPFLFDYDGIFNWDWQKNTPDWPESEMTSSEWLSKMEALLAKALAPLGHTLSSFIPSSFLAKELYSDALARLADLTEDLASATASALGHLILKAASVVPDDIKIPKIPSIPSVKPNPQLDLDVIKRKDWPGFNIGDHDIVGAESLAYYELRGSETAQAAEAYGRASAYVLSHELNLISGRADYRVDSEAVKASLALKTFAKDIADLSYNNDSTLELSSYDISNSDHPLRASFKKTYSHRFFVGPVPVGVDMGVSGFVRLDYEVIMNPVAVHGGIEPTTQVDGIADGYAGFKGLLAAGVEASLTFIDLAIPLFGDAKLLFDDVGRPSVTMDIIGDVKVDSLRGRIEAYAQYVVPRWGIPPWKKKKKSTTIFKWRGLTYSKRIFNWGLDFGESGVRMRGDHLDQTDIEHEKALNEVLRLDERNELLTGYENDVNQRTYQYMSAVANDLSTTQAVAMKTIVDTYDSEYKYPLQTKIAQLKGDFVSVTGEALHDSVQDTDGDGLVDIYEQEIGTSTTQSDTDGDGMSDRFEVETEQLDPNSSADAGLDFDGDGYTNVQEYAAGSDLNNAGSTPETVAQARELTSWFIPVLHILLH